MYLDILHVSEIRPSAFAIMVDETIDVSTTEQVVIALRWVDVMKDLMSTRTLFVSTVQRL